MIPGLVVATRLHLDDFNIFKIWFAYHKELSDRFCCCIHERPGDDISEMTSFCIEHGIDYTLYQSPEFANRPTLDKLIEIIRLKPARVVLHIDCDEFITNFGNLRFLCDRIDVGIDDSFTCWMVDRVNETGELYDISNCKTYDELCAVAPIRTNINEKFYLADYKCFLNKWPLVGFIHEPDRGIESEHVNCNVVSLDHFKWRKEWHAKAKRRVAEVKAQRLDWAHRLENCLNAYEQTGKV